MPPKEMEVIGGVHLNEKETKMLAVVAALMGDVPDVHIHLLFIIPQILHSMLECLNISCLQA
jgi:hypothetical protein